MDKANTTTSESAQLSALNLVAGRWIPAFNSNVETSINPADGSVVGQFSNSTDQDAGAAIAAARHAFDHSVWSSSPRKRQLAMLKWADALEQDLDGLTSLLTMENGKPLAEARREVAGAISEVRYYAGICRHIPGHAQEVEPGAMSIVTREPVGVVGAIVPWNAPAVLLVRAIAPALAAGCAVVVKPAPQTTLFTARVLRPLNDGPDVPPGVVNMVSERGNSAAECLVASPDVDVISFTGSTAVGKQIMAAAAGTLKRLSLELGGRACCLVFDDCDIDAVAKKLAAAATIIAGQQCTGARRVLVERGAYDRMKASLKSALADVKVGSGLAPDVNMGPMIDHSARGRVEAQLEKAYALSDEVVLQGHELDGHLSSGSFLTPSLVTCQTGNTFFSQEEIFGPLVALEPFDTEEGAVTSANNTDFGLAASVWTNDLSRAFRVARALKKGTVWLNNHNKLFAEAEAGGYKRSGFGRMHGYNALNEFLEWKHVYLEYGAVPAFAVRIAS